MMDADSISRIHVAAKSDVENGVGPDDGTANSELESNVHKEEQLVNVPAEFLSGDPKRPLLYRDHSGNEYTYVLKPMFYSVVFILVVELLERLSYYGINFTQMAYLGGQYNSNWSMNMTTPQASAYVGSSVAITYTMPFVGAIMADTFIGNFFTILLFSIGAYLPGLLLIALSAYPYLLGPTFPSTVLSVAMLGLYPLGAGAIKACVNILGAQQYHPLLQKAQIERYYVNFYLAINIGALIGGMVIPVVVQTDVFAGYMIPVVCFAVAILVFIMGSRRYVKMRPQGKDNLTVVKITSKALCCLRGFSKQKKSNGGKYPDTLVSSIVQLASVIPVTLLVVPFNLAYSQMVNTFVAQGLVMQPVGFVNAAWMNNFDAFSVIAVGSFVTFFLYPFLEKRNMSLHISTKFLIGTLLGAAAMLCAIIVDYKIHSEYNSTGNKISVMWQTPAFFFVGAGEIFAISSAYEAAFLIAPKNLKALSSATNLFLIGGLPQLISTALLSACENMAFTNSQGTGDLSTLPLYVTGHVYKYYWVLFGINMLGVVINALPMTKRFLTNTLARAEQANSDEATGVNNTSFDTKAAEDQQPPQDTVTTF